MATFLLRYSDSYAAKTAGWPLEGSSVEIETLADIDDLMARFDGTKVIFSPPSSPLNAPYWAEHHFADDPEDCVDGHRVETLPENWREMRWVEIYNGYRE